MEKKDLEVLYLPYWWAKQENIEKNVFLEKGLNSLQSDLELFPERWQDKIMSICNYYPLDILKDPQFYRMKKKTVIT